MPDNRPRAREKHVTSGGAGVHKRGEGLGGGPVGSGSGGSRSSGGRGVSRAAIGGGGLSIVAIIVLLLGHFMGGTSGSTGGGLAGAPSGYTQETTTGDIAGNEGTVDNTVASGSREKYTTIKGNGKDTVTLMVYMCGTDLESKHGMASNDLGEMAAADYGDNVNIIVYTGGCSRWKTSGISNTTNQIFQVKNGGLKTLVADDGNKAMTDPGTLSAFIKYCKQNFPADRNELILWDHGGGSVSGYGYDEKKKNGSMTLGGIDQALKDGGVQFDFVGFDACLMATAETALMLGDHADYMIASEETEPGIGWYYTNWLTKLGKNTSMPTTDLGKLIVDDFVTTCAKQTPGSTTTLSVIDLAEFSNTIPENLKAFSNSVTSLIKNEDYKTVSDARYATREFAKSSKIDQVDLADLAARVNTSEGKKLASALKSAVKYNRTSTNISNAYGVSIYFPYQRTSYVDKACSTYSQIGMDQDYSECIRQFAKLETSGQIASGGTGSPIGSLFGFDSSSSGNTGADVIGSLLSSFMTGGRSMADLDDQNTDFMEADGLSQEQTAEYLAANLFDESALVWEQDEEGRYTMELTEKQWELVHLLDLNMFYDDGTGYVDLGLDNVFSFDDGKLVADISRNWVSINGQPVAYYHTDTVDNGSAYTISGYVPCRVNGDRAKLLLAFDNDHPEGYVTGYVFDYVDGETDTVAKTTPELQNGDQIDFVCDYYDYSGNYQDSYLLGNTLTVSGPLTISNTDVGTGAVKLTYKFTDIYDREYWSEAISN